MHGPVLMLMCVGVGGVCEEVHVHVCLCMWRPEIIVTCCFTGALFYETEPLHEIWAGVQRFG